MEQLLFIIAGMLVVIIIELMMVTKTFVSWLKSIDHSLEIIAGIKKK